MKIEQHVNRKSRVSCFIKTSRLILRAEIDEEMSYLAWLADHVRCGNAHELYLQEKAKEPGVLDGLAEDELINAREVYRSICEGRSVNLDIGDVEDLEVAGLVRDVIRLPGRGRHAGRFEFTPTDRLYVVVHAMALKGRATL